MLSVYKEKPPDTGHVEAEVETIADSLGELSLVGMFAFTGFTDFIHFTPLFEGGGVGVGEGRDKPTNRHFCQKTGKKERKLDQLYCTI